MSPMVDGIIYSKERMASFREELEDLSSRLSRLEGLHKKVLSGPKYVINSNVPMQGLEEVDDLEEWDEDQMEKRMKEEAE